MILGLYRRRFRRVLLPIGPPIDSLLSAVQRLRAGIDNRRLPVN